MIQDYTCSNCGAALTGSFCAQCGQNRKNYVRSSWRIIGDLIAEVFELDSRLVRTTKALLFNPGFLSQEFSRNRRAAYVPPARLYLIVSIAFFTVLSLAADFATAPIVIGEDVKPLDETLNELPPEQRERVEEAIDEAARVGVVVDHTTIESDLERAINTWARDLASDPARAYQQFISHLPVAMFIMLPLYTFWMKLLYPRRFLAEHLVFALHLHAFLFVIGTLVLLLPNEMPTGRSSVLEIIYGPGVFLNGALQIAGGVYYLLALRRMYEQSWLATTLKFVVVNIGHIVFLVFGAAGVAAVMFLLR